MILFEDACFVDDEDDEKETEDRYLFPGTPRARNQSVWHTNKPPISVIKRAKEKATGGFMVHDEMQVFIAR